MDTHGQIGKNGRNQLDNFGSAQLSSGSVAVVIVFFFTIVEPATCHAHLQNWDSSSEIATSTQYNRVVVVTVVVVVVRFFCV